jgi:primosomal protein N' (replication factor Y)
MCHVCGRRQTTPGTCTDCGGPVSIFKGVGTQRVANELTRLFAGIRVLRLDTDATRRRGALEQALETFRHGEADVLLGTQMVAKGLDFPNVTLVGVVNADLGLALPDFRSPERTFQLLTQVAGRSGRGRRPGHVIFQTNRPQHYALTAAAEQEYESFYRQEMAARTDPPYPPHCRLVNLLFDGRHEDRVVAEAERTASFLEKRIEVEGAPVELMGPAPQPFSRLKGKHRWHITLRGRSHKSLHLLAGAALEKVGDGHESVRVGIDVDPVSLL